MLQLFHWKDKACISNSETVCSSPFISISADKNSIHPVSGLMDRASATEMMDTGSIPGRIKPEDYKKL